MSRGEAVLGFRAPEWSLRALGSARLPIVAEAGFLYDSSLNPCLFAGRPGNPRLASRLRWDRAERTASLLEFPPLTFGGALRLPAGSWTGRLVNPDRLVRAALEHSEEGGLPVAVVHPWEISGRPTPGRLRGLAKFIHETGRRGSRSVSASCCAAFPGPTSAPRPAWNPWSPCGRSPRAAPSRAGSCRHGAGTAPSHVVFSRRHGGVV